MRPLYLSAALLTAVTLLAACGTTTPADHARMDAYHTMNAAGARGAPTPSDMAAMGYHKTTKQIEETGMASQPAPNRLANLRSIWKIEN